MKNLFITLALIIGMLATGQTKKTATKIRTIPIEVEMAFQKQFPNSAADWQTTYMGDDLEQRIFEGEFKLKGVTATAMYTKEGFFKALEMDIDRNELPAEALNYMKTNYPKDKITEVLKIIDNNDLVLYEVAINREDKKLDYIFDASGYFLRFIEEDLSQ